MDAREHGQHAANMNGFCRLEWIAQAIDAAHRHKEDQHRIPPMVPRRPLVIVRIHPERQA